MGTLDPVNGSSNMINTLNYIREYGPKLSKPLKLIQQHEVPHLN